MKRNLEPPTIPITCPVCRACRLDLKTGHCVHGGPYLGYKEEPDAIYHKD